MPEVYMTGVAMSAHAFPSVIEEMARGTYPLDGWVETIAFDAVVDQGLERLRRQEGLKILVEVGR
jgi:(R,R)-butanediol dehydrogenase/meso-butanediol dehydrogenase/diacetyl reductase